MSEIELVIGCLAMVTLAVWVAGRLSIPYPIVLLAAGLGVGLAPGVPEVELEPEVIFLVFLPPLIHAAAWQSSPRQLRERARTVSLLAIGNVAASTLAVAAVARAVIPDMDWSTAIVLGAVLSPTDTVAATAVFRRLGVPERIVTLVEGESLVNDGAALVLYRIAVAAVATGTFSLLEAGAELLLVGTGGAAVGLGVAFAIRWARARVDDSTTEITITLFTPYVAWIAAEALTLSGILAAVSSGLYLGWRASRDISPATRLQAQGFWSVLVYVLESLLFVLIGLQIPNVIDALDEESAARLALWALIVSATVILARVLFQLTAGELERAFDRRRSGQARVTGVESAIVAWSGMRGAVSLAAALAIPLETDAGAPFPHRELILFLTLATIAVTLVLQGLTMPLLIRRLPIEEEETDERQKAVARFRTVEAALTYVSEMAFDEEVPAPLVERARSMYAERARQLTGACRTGVLVEESDLAAWTDLRRRLLAVERAELLALRDEGKIGTGAVREVEADLDLEDARLDRVARRSTDGAAAPVGASR